MVDGDPPAPNSSFIKIKRGINAEFIDFLIQIDVLRNKSLNA